MAEIARIDWALGLAAMIAFVLLALIYVIVAFADITASTFIGVTEEPGGDGATFNPGGAVAAA